MTEAGLANQGASVVLELQKLGINEADAVQIYKSSNSSYNQASKYFKDPNSKNFKRYLESTSKEQTNENIKENLKTQLNNKEIAYNLLYSLSVNLFQRKLCFVGTAIGNSPHF